MERSDYSTFEYFFRLWKFSVEAWDDGRRWGYDDEFYITLNTKVIKTINKRKS